MKNLFLGVAAVAAMMFVACSDDSGTSANDNDESSLSSSSVILSDDGREGSSAASSSSVKTVSSSSIASTSSSSSSAVTSSSSSSSVIPGTDPESSSSSTGLVVYSSSGDVIIEIGGSSSSDSGELSESSSSVIVYEGMACDKEGSRYYASWDEDGSWYICRNGIYVWELPLNDGEYSGVTYDSIMDARDGQVYKTVVINGVTVFAQNLNYGKMVPGSDSTDNQSDDSVVEKYCYNDSVKFCNRFGGLYQWAEAMGLPSSCNTSSTGACAVDTSLTYRGACPEGWHVPNKLEYAKMRGINTAENLKSSLYWYDGIQSGNGTNSSGFTMLPSGWRDTGAYAYLYEDSYLWITDFKNDLYSYKIGTLINSTMPDISISQKVMGMAVRCFKD